MAVDPTLFATPASTEPNDSIVPNRQSNLVAGELDKIKIQPLVALVERHNHLALGHTPGAGPKTRHNIGQPTTLRRRPLRRCRTVFHFYRIVYDATRTGGISIRERDIWRWEWAVKKLRINGYEEVTKKPIRPIRICKKSEGSPAPLAR